MHPPTADAQAILATVSGRGDLTHLVKVFTGTVHGAPLQRDWPTLTAASVTLRAVHKRVATAVLATAVLTTALLGGCTWPGPPTPTSAEPAATLRATSVSDGDTFTATDANGARVRIRLLGIDAPEAARDGSPADCGADQATAALSRLITGRSLALATDPVADPVDRFGRRLVFVTVDGHDVALSLVQAGMAAAWYPASEPTPTRYSDYRAAEAVARAAKTGLWAVCDEVGR